MSWLNCSHCGKGIEDDERHIAITLAEEVFEGGAITVIWEDEIMTFCMKCAELHDFKRIAVPLKTFLHKDHESRNQSAN